MFVARHPKFQDWAPNPNPPFPFKMAWFKTKATCVVLIFNPPKKTKISLGNFLGYEEKGFL
jgi:hypothetical protein